jgi:hypothetical protein
VCNPAGQACAGAQQNGCCGSSGAYCASAGDCCDGGPCVNQVCS